MIIEIDGSHGEGGGQIIRTALSLSAITKQSVRIYNIRAGRSNPGLQMQHLTACKAVRSVCRGTLVGAELNSTELVFEPGDIIGGKYEFDIGTAGSTVLVAQTLIPILLHSDKKSELTIKGGTHVMKSPSYDYFEKVFVPAVKNFGVELEANLLKPGYYPKGGGEMRLTVEPNKELKGCLNWAMVDGGSSDSDAPVGPGHDEHKVQTIIRLSGLPTSIAIREKKIFVQNSMPKVFLREDDSLSVGNAITSWSDYRGIYVLGEKGKRAEDVAQEVLDQFKRETYDVDMHLADQLLIYAVLASGQTSYRTSAITEHLRTNASVIIKFLHRIISIDEIGLLIKID